MTSTSPLVLIVEDDVPMRRFLRAALAAQSFRLTEAATLREAMALATSMQPELVLLDLGLPDGDGIAFTSQLRQWSQVPIIVLSARGGEADKVSVLDAGADDYLTKPFSTNELLARIRVALRHAANRDQINEPVVTIDALCVDLGRREVTRNGQPIHLTPIEFRMLALFARNLGRMLTHRQILHEVWGVTREQDHHYVRVHMASLRRKIEDDPARPRFLITEPGVGYRLRER